VCGRFVATSSRETISLRFAATTGPDAPPPFPPRYNVSPGQPIEILVAGASGRRELAVALWGLVPPSATDPGIGKRLINARSETAASKPAFRHAFAGQRCIIPADGFYEWQEGQARPRHEGAGGAVAGRGERKIPWYIAPRDGLPLALAGLWERRRDGGGASFGVGHILATAVILTTPANSLLAPIHDRMPAILPRASWEAWLAPGELDPGHAAEMLRPAPDTLLEARMVTALVNDPRHDGHELVAPELVAKGRKRSLDKTEMSDPGE